MSSYFRHITGSLIAIAIGMIPRPYGLFARSPTREAKWNLGAIKVAQESYKASHDRYRRCDWPRGDDANCLDFKPPRKVRYRYACNTAEIAGQSEFTCAAVGDLDNDGQHAVFIIGSNNSGGTAILAPLPAIAVGYRCAPGVSRAGEIVECNPGRI